LDQLSDAKPEETNNENELVEAAMEAAREDLLAFCMLMNPNFVVAPHHRLMADELMAVERGENKRLMIFISPRSTKSLMSSVYYVAWCIGRHTQWETMAISYSGNLSTAHGREVRNLVMSEPYRALFPHVELRKDSRAADRWQTSAGGVFVAGGITSGIAGKGANLAVIDDPLSEQEAFSKAARERVKTWYPGGLRTRLMPSGRIVIVSTRWHEDDLSGWLLSMQNQPGMDQWRVIEIPALLTEDSVHNLSIARNELMTAGWLPPDAPEIKEGESYWPPLQTHLDMTDPPGLRGWTTDELKTTQQNMPPYQWNALYMQRPTAEEGQIIRRKSWKNWEGIEPPKCHYILISMDTAYSKETHADYSAFIVWGVFTDQDGNANLIMLDADRGRWEYSDLRQRANDLYMQWRPDAMLIEKKASGQSLIQDLRLSGVPVIDYFPDKDRDKIARAHSVSPLFHAGRVHTPKNRTWAEMVIEECARFPNGPDDDWVDCVVQACIWLRSGTWIKHPNDSPYGFGEEEEKGWKSAKKRRWI
jgi:predicted phage terminase large subunit-like protein